MLARLKKIGPSNSVYAYHVILLFLSLTLIFPFDSEVMSFFIILGTIIIITLIVKPSLLYHGVKFKNKKKNIKIISRRSKYYYSIVYALLSSLLCLIIITSFRYKDYIGFPIFFIFLILYVITFSISISMYINNSSDYLAKEKNILFWAVRIIGLVTSFLVFSLAKNWVMRYMDITILEASSKVTVFAYVIILFFIISYFFIAIIKIPMLMFESKEVELKKINNLNGKKFLLYVKYDSIPISFTLTVSFLILFLFFFMNNTLIGEFIIKSSLRMDTVNSFYCDGSYKILNEHKNARYFRVSDENYRVFLPNNGDWKTYRLKCTNVYPYYTMQPVLTNINSIGLQMKADELIKDVESFKN